VAALDKLATNSGLVTYNLGTGQGHSVKEVISAFECSTNQLLQKRIGPRRAGDVPEYFTNPDLARKELKWSAALTMEDICRDAWQWQKQNPNGYE
jgi:UDP-glucose 4-epimerase